MMVGICQPAGTFVGIRPASISDIIGNMALEGLQVNKWAALVKPVWRLTHTRSHVAGMKACSILR